MQQNFCVMLLQLYYCCIVLVRTALKFHPLQFVGLVTVLIYRCDVADTPRILPRHTGSAISCSPRRRYSTSATRSTSSSTAWPVLTTATQWRPCVIRAARAAVASSRPPVAVLLPAPPDVCPDQRWVHRRTPGPPPVRLFPLRLDKSPSLPSDVVTGKWKARNLTGYPFSLSCIEPTSYSCSCNVCVYMTQWVSCYFCSQDISFLLCARLSD